MNKKLVTLVATGALLVLPLFSLAVAPDKWFADIITRFIDYVVLPIFAGAVIIMFLWAGFLFLTAHGDPTKISNSKKAVIYALIGVALGLLSYSIIRFIAKLLGVPI